MVRNRTNSMEPRNRLTWWCIIANRKERRNIWGIGKATTCAICRIASNAIRTLPNHLGEMSPQCEVSDVRFAAICRVLIHFAVVQAFGDKLAHREWIGRIACAYVLPVTTAADIPVRKALVLSSQQNASWNFIGWISGTYVTCP